MYNPEQLQAINSHGSTVILAGPGTGKTHTLVGKALSILNNPAHKVVMVTFTRDSAKEIAERVSRRIQGLATRFQSGTFHSLALAQVKACKPGLVITDNGVKALLLKRVSAELGYDSDLPTIREDVEDFQNGLKAQLSGQAKECWDLYLQISENENRLDLASISQYAVAEMRSERIPVLDCTHLFVDEFQDVDKVQLAWVLEHAKRGIAVTVVGDDDQSIYAFRGGVGYRAFALIIDRLKPKVVKLKQNYRSAKSIIEHASSLISYNHERLSKPLLAVSNEIGKVTFKSFGDLDSEVDAVVNQIMMIGGEWGVLARTKGMLERVEAALTVYGVESDIKSSSDFWESSSASLFFQTMKYVASRGHKRHLIAYALHAAGRGENEIKQIIASNQFERCLMSSSIGQLLPQANALPGGDVVRQIGQCLQRYTVKGAFDLDSAANVWRSISARYQHSTKSIKEICADIERLSDPQQGSAQISLRTFHGSKGLEFDHVWVLGVNEKNVPNAKLITSLEEERRLLFVAVTRAKKELTLSWSMGNNARSRFLDEFPGGALNLSVG